MFKILVDAYLRKRVVGKRDGSLKSELGG